MIKIAILLAAFGAIAAQSTSTKQFKAYSLAQPKCRGAPWSGCCTTAKRCGEGEGDCDYNSQCAAGLVCGKNNCPWFGKYKDCCTKNIRCKGKWHGCCTKTKPCGLGDGDCDNDGECAKGLVCGKDNCPEFGSGKDCCTKPLRCKGEKWNGCCTKAKRCGEGEGDCDNDGQCAAGLVCGKNNCPWFGSGKDCCTKPFILKKIGKCTSLSEKACKNYSISQGVSFAKISGGSWPRGCYHKIGYKVYFNTRSMSTAPCSMRRQCVCTNA